VSSRLILLTALVTLATGAPVLARPKTDVIVMKNGDRFTGEIKGLDRGQLSLSTDSAGTISIEWIDVAEVTAPYQFEIETRTGALLLASLTSAGPGRAEIVGALPPRSIDLADIVRLVPIGQSFWQRIDGSLDLGFSYTQSSGVVQLNTAFETTLRRPSRESTASFNSFFTRQPEVPDSDRSSFQFGQAWLRSGGWRIFAVGQLDRNPDMGFDLRAIGSAGAGRDFLRTNRRRFSVGGGLTVNREYPVDAPNLNNIEAMFLARYALFSYNYPKTNLDIYSVLSPSLSDTGRVRVEFSGQVRRELLRDFTMALTVYNSYDNRPPTEGAEKNDVALSLSLGWTF
jgi:hypothetical protein